MFRPGGRISQVPNGNLTGLLLFLLAINASCSKDKETSQTDRADPVRTTDKIAPVRPDTTPANGTISTTNDATESTTWAYEDRVEAADEPVTHRASLTSPTRLQFGFPYAGGSTVKLSLRKRNDDALVSLHVLNGAFNKSFQGGTIQIRFDAGSPITYRYSAAENGSATVIFLDQSDAVIRQLKSSRRAIVNLDFYNQGNRQFVFETADLRWPY